MDRHHSGDPGRGGVDGVLCSGLFRSPRRRRLHRRLRDCHRLQKYAGRLPATLFALALLDASIIGAAAVSLATAYAIGDVFSLKHSPHRKPHDAKGFYGVYFGLIILSAVLVLTPGTPLGLLTNAVQTLAGVLLPSATVFLLLLSNDKAVLGPWVNSRKLNLFTGAIIAALVMLSVILTASVLFPDMEEQWIVGILVGGSVIALVVTIGVKLFEQRVAVTNAPGLSSREAQDPDKWRMAEEAGRSAIIEQGKLQ
jgi:Natural resistance-associated macrophage protein